MHVIGYFYVLTFIYARFALCQNPQVEGDPDGEDDTPSKSEPDEYITRTKEYLLSQIFTNYSNRVRPCGAHPKEEAGECGPVEVKIYVYLRTVDSVNDKDSNFDMQLIFRQTWDDPRLKYTQHLQEGGYHPEWLTLRGDEPQYKVWLPDTYFINEKQAARGVDRDNVVIAIKPDGNVFYTFRVTATFDCSMNFRYYPKDIHRCFVDMSSYAHTEKHIVYKWREHNAVLMSKDFKQNVAKFELDRVRQEECPMVTTTGKYSCMRLNVQIKRTFHFAQFGYLYLPSFVLVCISWLTFWLGTDAIVARSMVALFCFLTVIIQTTLVSTNFPPADDIRSIDIWITVCMAFLVAVMLQLVMIYRITRSESRKRNDQKTIELVQIAEVVEQPQQRKKTTKSDRPLITSQTSTFSGQFTPLVNP